MAFATLKIAVLAPIPSAIVATAVTRNTGFLRSVRHAYNKSFKSTLLFHISYQRGNQMKRPDVHFSILNK